MSPRVDAKASWSDCARLPDSGGGDHSPVGDSHMEIVSVLAQTQATEIQLPPPRHSEVH